MSIKVKICGLKTSEAVVTALEAGADFIGLVFFPKSPRNVTVADARVLAAAARGRACIVALVVDADDRILDAIVADVDPDMIQLHGSETPERVSQIKARTAKKVMKAIKVETEIDARAALSYRGIADLILFDAKAPLGMTDALPGGNGLSFDWRILAGVKDQVPFMLSGGLTPDNVAEAIRATNARMVDVSSGVESAPGVKDHDLIRRFITAAKSVTVSV